MISDVLTDWLLEKRIAEARKQFLRAADRLGCDDPLTREAHEHFRQLILMRSEGQVARMENERGLM